MIVSPRLLAAFVCLGLSILMATPAQGVEVVPGRERYPLGQELLALVDEEATLSIGEAAGALGYRPLGALGEAPPGAAIWLRFTARARGAAQGDMWLLTTYGRTLSHVEFYFPVGQGAERTWLVEEVGPDPRGQEHPLRPLAFELPPLTGEPRSFFLRLEGSALHLAHELAVASPEADAASRSLLVLRTGLFIGTLTAVGLLNLFIWIVLRDGSRLWYLAYVAAVVASFSATAWPLADFYPVVTVPGLYRLYSGLAGLVVLFAGLFGRSFLMGGRYSPLAERLLLVCAGSGFLLAVLAPFASLPFLAWLGRAVGVLMPAATVSAGVLCLRQGFAPARWYTLAWSIRALGVLALAIPLTASVLIVYQTATVIEAVVLTLALGERVRAAQERMAQSERLAALGRLVAGVAHEVQNPNNLIGFNLPVLRRYVGALREAVPPGSEVLGRPAGAALDDVEAIAADMETGSRRITELVRELKNFTRGHAGEPPIRQNPADIAAAVETLVAKQAQKAGVRFEVETGQELPAVLARPGGLEQVLVNLVLNGVQAIEAADGQGEALVRLSVQGRSGAVVFGVEDTGGGIPRAVQRRIFDPFYTTRSPGGTGLGLAISRRIVEEMGGTIDFETRPGRTLFRVVLPAANPTQES
jgi:signal transduction histidine kinase